MTEEDSCFLGAKDGEKGIREGLQRCRIKLLGVKPMFTILMIVMA